ncbi:hypothetical protein ES703_117943 [subsurface metagenome]
MALSSETKAVLNIIIREIQDCQTMEKVKSILDSWIKANDLHPEEVQTFFSLADEGNLMMESLIAQFGEFKKVARMSTGVAYKVPTRDIIEKGILEQELDQYPKWED